MSRYTTEELEDNYEFKVIRRVLKKEFPWIKDMKMSKDWDQYHSLFFVDITFDNDEFMKVLGLPEGERNKSIWDWVSDTGVPYLGLAIPFNRYKGKSEEANDLGKVVKKTIDRVQKSSSIPTEMKLPREVSISSWKTTRQPDTNK